MNEQTIYSEIILSKTGIEIPVLKSGKTVDSRYDPVRESSRLLEQIKPETHFLIITGIASGTLINAVLENRADIFILAVEKNDSDIEFLKKLSLVKKLSDNKRVCLCSISTLQDKIIELYLPAFYGNLQVIEQRGWITENFDSVEIINSSINKAVGIVSADFSVQSHFGKLWHHNILSNIKSINKTFCCENFPIEKTAVILAAGPTLDSTIQKIKNNKDQYYIIATDTALSITASYKIIPNAVVSIDGQNISNVHFTHSSNLERCDTLFLFDLCANSSAVNYVLQNQGKISFFTSGHPFSEYINKHFSLNLPSLFSGAGTVTISAVDFAFKAGFKNIEVIGADFSYSNGKPYAKGTYLDRLYNQKANRFLTTQKQFSALEFRTELIKKNAGCTTQILEAYRTSFEQYLNNNGFDFSKKNDTYKIVSKQKHELLKFPQINNITPSKILEELKQIYKSKNSNTVFNTIFDLTESDVCILPLISWLRNYDNKDRSDFNYFYNKALLIYSGLGGN